jgi:hypothetical protein
MWSIFHIFISNNSGYENRYVKNSEPHAFISVTQKPNERGAHSHFVHLSTSSIKVISNELYTTYNISTTI